MARLDNKLTDSKQKKAPGGYKPEQMPAEIAEAVNERNAQAALDKLDAMTQELAQDSASDAVLDGLIPLPELPEPGVVPKVKLPEPTLAQQGKRKQPFAVIPMPKHKHVSTGLFDPLPAAAEKAIAPLLEEVAIPDPSACRTAAEYFAARDELLSMRDKYPAVMPKPEQLRLEFVDGMKHVDLHDLLTQGRYAGDYPKLLKDMILYACSFQKGVAGQNIDRALRRLDETASDRDNKLKQEMGVALLNKFRTLISLAQTKAFGGKPEALAECLLEDWRWVQQGIVYKTPIQELMSSPVLFDSDTMQPGGFIKAGPLAQFVQAHADRLIDSYTVSGLIRTPDSNSISVQTQQKYAYIQTNRRTAELDAPVTVTLGYSEQYLPNGSMTSEGLVESTRSVDVLTLRIQGGEIQSIDHAVPADSGIRAPVLEAVQVLKLLAEQGK